MTRRDRAHIRGRITLSGHALLDRNNILASRVGGRAAKGKAVAPSKSHALQTAPKWIRP
jgi:hypothetical protein